MKLKKLLALLLSVILLLSLAACGSDSDDDDDSKDSKANAKVEAFVEEQGDAFVSSLEESFAGTSGMTCNSTIEAEGDGIIVKIKVNELEDVPQETKDVLQESMDGIKGTLKQALEELQREVPELKSMKLYICDKSGDELAKVTIKN